MIATPGCLDSLVALNHMSLATLNFWELQMLKSATVIACLLASATVGNAQSSEQIRKQGVRECLAEAEQTYKRNWQSACPGGLNGPRCRLSFGEVAGLDGELMTERSNCYSANAAGLFTPDEPIVMPGTGTTEPQQLPLDPEPRRKFWISPQ